MHTFTKTKQITEMMEKLMQIFKKRLVWSLQTQTDSELKLNT